MTGKIVTIISISKWVVFWSNNGKPLAKKHLYNKRLVWKQNKRYLVHFTFSKSFKSSLQNFKSLKVRVLEIIGGRGGGEGG